MRVENCVTIDRPIDEVFAFVSDLNHWPEYISLIKSIKKTSQGPTGEGTTFEECIEVAGKTADAKGRIVAYHPPHELKLAVQSSLVHGTITMHLSQHGSSTTVEQVAKGAPGGLLQLAGPLLKGTVQSRQQEALNKLKTLLQS